MKKQYFVNHKYNHKETTSAVMREMMDNVHSELFDMKYYFDKDNTAEAYEHYKNALAELDKISFKELEFINVDTNANNASKVSNYD